MKFPRPPMSIPLALVTGAVLMFTQHALAEKAWPPAAAAEGLSMSPHQGKALVEVHPAGTVDHGLLLTGDQEVPAVKTSATGTASITIGADKAVGGEISTTGIVATAAHIHIAAPGKNGPVVITLLRAGDNGWKVPAGSVLSTGQYANFKAGELYVNVHSAAHAPGEIRAQLKP